MASSVDSANQEEPQLVSRVALCYGQLGSLLSVRKSEEKLGNLRKDPQFFLGQPHFVLSGYFLLTFWKKRIAFANLFLLTRKKRIAFANLFAILANLFLLTRKKRIAFANLFAILANLFLLTRKKRIAFANLFAILSSVDSLC